MRSLITSAMFLALCQSTALAENFTEKHKAILESKRQLTYDDFAHENPGCPENSICSEEMGRKMAQWNKFTKGLSQSKASALKLEQYSLKLEQYRKKHGIPVVFLADKSSVLSLDPILYASRCKEHNPKEADKKVYRGIQFFRNDPNSESAQFDSVLLYNGNADNDEKAANKNHGVSFKVPYEEVPLMIKDGSLILAREYEELFYYLSIDSKGKWKIVSPPKKDVSTALMSMENASCPESDKTAPDKNHLKFFCKKIWNADKKKAELIRLAWSCP